MRPWRGSFVVFNDGTFGSHDKFRRAVADRPGASRSTDGLARHPPTKESVGLASPASRFPVDQMRVFDSPIPI